MQWSTICAIPEAPAKISLPHRLLLMGSCFTENIGAKLLSFRFDACINPFGILFHPLALADVMQMAISGNVVQEDELFLHADLYRHFAFHSQLAHPDRKVAAGQMQAAINTLNKAIHNADHIIVTFGTSLVYTHSGSGRIVANNHKLPASEFTKRQLSVEEIVGAWLPMMEQISHVKPGVQWIFTVSPVRHLRDGMIENARSKAVLIESIHQIVERSSAAVYFPAYEIMMDELRDYRFYNEDLIHPSGVATDHIWELFSDKHLDIRAQAWLRDYYPVQQAMRHRPNYPDSSGHRQFMAQMRNEIESLRMRYPELDLQEDYNSFS